jgi:hypothetical protein
VPVPVDGFFSYKQKQTFSNFPTKKSDILHHL